MLCVQSIGGKGNTSFTSSTHQRPMETTPGEEGRVRTLTLEMKILADIGLVRKYIKFHVLNAHFLVNRNVENILTLLCC